MNPTKLNRIREEIMMADQICSDISIHTILKKLQYINEIELAPDEMKKILNRYGEQLSLACEHYLKSIVISRMHYEGISNESEEELNRIFDNRDNQGVAKKYSHYFDKLLTSDNTALKESPGLQESILLRLAERLKIPEFIEYRNKQLQSWITDDNTGIDLSKEVLLNKIKAEVNKNRSAYPESRYGMFTDYEADIEFLLNLCLTLQEYHSRTLNNCLFIPGLERHIFPDDESEIIETRSDGTKITYIYYNNKPEIIECNGVRKEDLTQHQQINDVFPSIIQNKDVVEISYTENEESFTLKYDKFLECICKTKNTALQKETSKSK